MAELSPVLAEHLRSPRGVGRPQWPCAEGRGSNPACGDDLRLYVGQADGALRLRFEASACSAVIATASLLVEALDGASRAFAEAFDVNAAIEAAGGLPRHRSHAPRVVQRALDEALVALDRTSRDTS
ncbi:iron-sulfur cluster assembly scaffold protein [Engelhardtia mirabilis]|uniref:NifU-like protein n=1 Tax=Engelhardtia mirabilis TaxID=2528011 RepID=A0A518BPU5_9BACT|nr:NifU-like protein [Planctomycetes bacterium Pla133]QDV03319.1 NifU-like protein [Planctomycetes bacterium Pla86]